jgi:hypothetical protein
VRKGRSLACLHSRLSGVGPIPRVARR